MTKTIYDIFISYRRDGGGATAGRINDMLTADGYLVSYDVDTLREGRFDEQLLKRIEECQDFILVVDKNCFVRTINPVTNPKDDWLWQELSYALRLKKNVIPVLLAGASFPKNLPKDIADVRYCHGPQCVHEYFDSFYTKLKDFLHAHPRMAKPQHVELVTPSNMMPCLKIKPDMDCVFYLDGEEHSHLKAGIIQKIPLAKGEYELMFVSEDNETDNLELDFEMPEEDKLMKVSLREIMNRRVQKDIGPKRSRGESNNTLYDVVLVKAGAAKLQVVKAVKENCGLGLKEAKDLVDGAPSILRKNMSFVQASILKEQISSAGATVEMLSSEQSKAVTKKLGRFL